MNKNVLLFGVDGCPHSLKTATIVDMQKLPDKLGDRGVRVIPPNPERMQDYQGNLQSKLFEDPTQAQYILSTWLDEKKRVLLDFVNNHCEDGDIVFMENDIYYHFNVSNDNSKNLSYHLQNLL